jgi:UrcA family protein
MDAALNTRPTHNTNPKENIMKTIITILATAAIATLTAGTAQAQTETIDRSVTVRHGDLNLTKADDFKTLERRISRAAGGACGGVPNSRDLKENQDFDTCRKAAVNRAMAAITHNTTPTLATR